MIFHCPHCGIKVRPSEKSCPTCSKRMLRGCPHCAEEIAVTATLCKYCGEAVAVSKPKLRVAPKPEPGIEFIDEPDRKVPWEDTTMGVFRRWWGTFFVASLAPGSFFRSMSPTGGHRWPVGYSFGLVAQLLVVALVALAGTGAYLVLDDQNISQEAAWSTFGIFAASIPASFLAITISLYLASMLWHLPVMVFGGKGGFQGTVRTVGYSTGTWLWALIPIAGPYIAGAMVVVQLYKGLRYLHKMGRMRAAFCLLLSPVVWAITAMAIGTVVMILNGGFDCCAPAEEVIQHAPPGTY